MPMQAESLEVLEKASVAPAQARAIVRAIEIEIAGAKRAELRGEMSSMTAQLCGEMAQLKRELCDEVAEQFGKLRADIAGLARHMFVALTAQTVVLLGSFYFFFTQFS